MDKFRSQVTSSKVPVKRGWSAVPSFLQRAHSARRSAISQSDSSEQLTFLPRSFTKPFTVTTKTSHLINVIRRSL
jgi:hypothetical protein